MVFALPLRSPALTAATIAEGCSAREADAAAATSGISWVAHQ